MAIDASDAVDWFKWALGIVLGAFGTIFTMWHFHQANSISEIQEVLRKDAMEGDNKLWAAMEAKHVENVRALAELRAEQRASHDQLLVEFRELRKDIAEDRRREIDRLVSEIHKMKL